MGRDEQLTTRVDEETKRAFRVAAAHRDMDMSELLRKLIYDFLDEEGEEGNKKSETVTAD